MRKNSSSRRKSIFDIDIDELDDFKSNNDDSMVEFIKQKFISVSNKNSSNILSHDKDIEGQEHYVSIQMSVIDTGVGMSEEGCKKLFIDFGKLDENSSRNK